MDKLTEEQIDAIAERAAEKTVQKQRDGFYRDVGKSVVAKFFYIVGACVVAMYVYFEKFTH